MKNASSKTSAEWWTETKANEKKLNAWLQKQYAGELGAVGRINSFRDKFTTPKSQDFNTLTLISLQELKHSEWVRILLRNRGIELAADHTTRYWNEILPEATDFKSGAAVGAHAEAMRLERIRVISEDLEAPEDIRKCFQNILHDEIWHEEEFRKMAGDMMMKSSIAEAQARAAEAIGLVL